MEVDSFNVINGSVKKVDFEQFHAEYQNCDNFNGEVRVDNINLNGATIDINSGQLDIGGAKVTVVETPTTTELDIEF
jgi:uncharacterized protein involved in outer membrane biogenesis